MLIFDIESDGFYADVTTIHCLGIYDTDTKATQSLHGGSIAGGLRRLMAADMLVGHNILKFDIPVIQKLFPWFKPVGTTIDTLILSRLLFPETGDTDDLMIKRGKLAPKYRGSHALEAWGMRLGVLKGEYEGDPAIEDPEERIKKKWAAWNPTMQQYCEQDVVVTLALLTRLQREVVPQRALDLEQAVARIISRQEVNGFCFDEEAAKRLLVLLSTERLKLEDDLKARFGFWFARADRLDFVPKKDDKKWGYVKGAAMTKVKAVYFNPGSRHHIARILQRNFAWRPTSFTPTGEPEVSEESLKAVRHPEAATLLRFLLVEKRLGQLSEGKEAWLSHVRNGKIHGNVNTLGTVTGRMSHSHPNIAQAPAGRSPFGEEMRSLFSARPGWALVGIDAAALELRILAAYMAPFDNGAYIKVVVEGKKEDGTEIHTVNRKALEIDSRDDAKTWFYAFIYGAGDEKLGMIVSKEKNKSKNSREGKRLRARFLANLPAMAKLIDRIKIKAKAQGWLTGVDGRKLHCRSPHSAPNTLFQSAGALVMKLALVILDTNLQAQGYVPGDDYEFVANIHDEYQVECRTELAEDVGRIAVAAIRQAGTDFALRCPLDGNFQVGRTWAETH